MNRRVVSIIVISSFVLLVLLFVGMFFIRGENQLVSEDRSSENPATYTTVVLENSEKLRETLSEEQILLLRENIHFYAVTSLDTFPEGAYVSGVVDDIKFEGNSISFVYTIDNDQALSVKLSPAKNDQLDLSISGPGNSIDELLPANSQESAFIKTLPLSQSDFSIDYIASEKSYFINIYDRDPDIGVEAKQLIKKETGISSEEEANINLLFPAPGGSFEDSDEDFNSDI